MHQRIKVLRAVTIAKKYVRGNWGGAFAKASGDSVTMNFFLLPFVSLSWALVFVPGL
jgi:transglutaminase-like putative cysteine protease